MTAAAEPQDAGLFSELSRSARGLRRVARERPLALVGAIAAVALLPTCACLLGFGLVPLLAALSLGRAREALEGTRSPFAAASLVAVSIPGLVPLATLLTLVGVGDATSPFVVAPALGAASAVAGGLVALVAGTAYHALGRAPLAESIERALGDTVRVGLARRALAGAVVGLVTTGLPFVLVNVLFPPPARGLPWILLVAPLALGVGLVWMLALGAPASHAPDVASGHARAALVRVLALGGPVLFVLVVAVALAASRPSPGHSVPTAAERATSREVGVSAELPGEHGLSVRRLPRGVSIEAADGGGVGPVDFGVAISEPGEVGDELRYAGSSASGWIVYTPDRWVRVYGPLGGAPRTRGVRVDPRGVRTDDGLLDRIAWRFGEWGLGLLLVAFGLAVPFAVRLARGIGGAALLDRGEDAGPHGAWSGAIDLDEEARARVEHGRLALEGGVRLVRDGGDGVLLLAPGTLVLGPEGPLRAGARVAVVAPRERLALLGPRSGAMRVPEGAWLVVGSLALAQERIVRDALRSAAAFGVPAALAALAASLASLLSS